MLFRQPLASHTSVPTKVRAPQEPESYRELGLFHAQSFLTFSGTCTNRCPTIGHNQHTLLPVAETSQQAGVCSGN